jgi:hypothetical protein
MLFNTPEYIDLKPSKTEYWIMAIAAILGTILCSGWFSVEVSVAGATLIGYASCMFIEKRRAGKYAALYWGDYLAWAREFETLRHNSGNCVLHCLVCREKNA